MAFDVAKVVFCFFYLLSKANCQVWQGEVVESKEKFPYHAFIETTYRCAATNEHWDFECGGVILGRRFVLTAGHCVLRRKKVDGKLVLRQFALLYFGMLRRDVDGDIGDFKQRTRVDRNEDFMVHEFWNSEGHDIALVHTRDEIRIDNFEVARAVLDNTNSLTSTMEQIGWECEVSGWGISTPEERMQSRSSQVLKFAKIEISNFYNDEILVGGVKPPRHGDSGGPLSCHPRSRPFNVDQHKSVYGVYTQSDPTRYTRIAAHINEISQLMRDHGEEVLLDGRDAVMGQFPHQAAVVGLRDLDFRCSGAVVSEWWVLSSVGCFENGLVVAGEVDLDGLSDVPFAFLIKYRQARVCLKVATKDNVQMCKVERAFQFNDFVQPIDLWPENFLPAECQFASWDKNPLGNRYHGYLRWKKANVEGESFSESGRHLDVAEVALLPSNDRKSAGVGLVCGGYLAGMSEWVGRRVRFVDIRGYREWINNNFDE